MSSQEFVDALNKKAKSHINLCVNEILTSEHFVNVKDVKELLVDFVVTRKPEEWEESVGEAFSKIHDEINRKLKFHGIYESDTTIMIDKKQDKFVVVPKQRLEEVIKKIPNCLDCEYCLGDLKGESHCSLPEQQHYDSVTCPKDKFLNNLKKELLGSKEEEEKTK